MPNLDHFINSISQNTYEFLKLKMEELRSNLLEINSVLNNTLEKEETVNLRNSIAVLKNELNRFQLLTNNKRVFYPEEQNEFCQPGNVVGLEIFSKQKIFHLDTVFVGKNTSIFEPLGNSLIGKKAGDSFILEMNGKTVKGTVLYIEPPSKVMELCFPKFTKK